MNYAYVAVMANDRFYPGLCALTASLKRVGARFPLYVVIPQDAPEDLVRKIQGLDLQVVRAPMVELDPALQKKNQAERWNITFFKLAIFNLTQFDKVVYLDLDMILLGNIDALFEKPHMAAVAAGNCVYADWTGLNSGLMVVEPNEAEFRRILGQMVPACEYRLGRGLGFGDQDVINFSYPDWYSRKELVLSEAYNTLIYHTDDVCRLVPFRDLKVIHCAEAQKPWHLSGLGLGKYLVGCVLRGKVNQAKAFAIYHRYVRESCPEYKSY